MWLLFITFFKCPVACSPDDNVWNSLATDSSGTYSCGNRISWLQTTSGNTEEEAKNLVATEFPSICGACKTFDPNPTLSPTPAPTIGPTPNPTSTPTGGSLVPDPTFAPPPRQTCFDVWDSLATDAGGTYSCGSRIGWLQTAAGGRKSEEDAKTQVAAEFLAICGSCSPAAAPAPPQTGESSLVV